jgi:hypothetical protein
MTGTQEQCCGSESGRIGIQGLPIRICIHFIKMLNQTNFSGNYKILPKILKIMTPTALTRKINNTNWHCCE